MFRSVLFYLSLLLLLLSLTVNILTFSGVNLFNNLSWTFSIHFAAIGIGMCCAWIAKNNPATSSLLDRSRSGFSGFGAIIRIAWQTRPKSIVITGIVFFCYAMFCFFWTFFPDNQKHADPSLPPITQQIIEDQLQANFRLITFSGVWIYIFFFCFGFLWKYRKGNVAAN